MAAILLPMEGQEMEKMLQASNAFGVFMLLGHHLAHFLSLTSRVDQLEYELEQERRANADLIREVNSCMDMLHKAQEKVFHRDEA